MRGDLARRTPCRPMSRMSRTGGAPPPRDRPRGARRSRGDPAWRASCGPRTPSSCSCGRDRSRFAGRHRAHSWHWAVGCGGRSRCSGRSRRRRRPASRRSARPRTPPCARRCTGRSAGWAVELRRYRQADALRRIALARLSSRTSFSSSLIRRASSVVVPGRSPRSISACPTHVRRASGWIPSSSAIRRTAPLDRSGSALATRRHPSRPLAQLQRVLP